MVQRFPAESSSSPAPLKPGSGWGTTPSVSQVTGSTRMMSSKSELVATQSFLNAGFQASPEMLGSSGLHESSVSPGVGQDGPATW